MAEPLLPAGQPMPLETVRAAEIAVVGGQDDRPGAGVAHQLVPDTAEKPRVGQLALLVLPRDMAARHKPLPQREGDFREISLFELVDGLRVHHVNRAVHTVHKKRFSLDLLVVLADQRQDYFVCADSHAFSPELHYFQSSPM